MKKIMTQDEKHRMMLERPIPGLICQMSVPTIISMLISSFYNMADTFFVGKIDTSATAAVGIVFPVMSIIQALGFFCGHGSGNSISRKLGAREDKEAEELASIGFFISLLLGLLIMILGLVFLSPLARVLGSTETILPYTEKYLAIILLGSPFMTAQLVLNNQLRFQGNAFYAMFGITAGAILNIVLDPILIFGFHMGISGAALATIISQFASFLFLLIGVRAADCIPIRLKNMKNIMVHFKAIAGGGFPSLCRQGLASVATLALNLAANPYGDAAIAAMSIVSRITMFAGSALIGFGQGFQPVCGFNYGAGRYDRVKEAFWFCVKVATAALVCLVILEFIFSDSLMAIFRKDDAEVIRIGTLAIQMQCVTFVLTGWVIMNNMMLQTIGKTVRATILAISRQGLFFLPAVLILPHFIGLAGIQMAQPVADVFSFITAIIMNRSIMKELAELPASVQSE